MAKWFKQEVTEDDLPKPDVKPTRTVMYQWWTSKIDGRPRHIVTHDGTTKAHMINQIGDKNYAKMKRKGWF